MIKCRDKNGARECYKILKGFHRVDLDDFIRYYRLVNPAIAFFLRVYRKLHTSIIEF